MNKLIGVFIEPRKLKQVYFNIDNFFEVLPTTILYFFCGKGLKYHYEFKFKKKFKNLKIIELEVNNFNFASYSDFMKSHSFWDNFKSDAEYCLTIQTDGCLCKIVYIIYKISLNMIM
tara:strand:+ start:991 stop:1341 length:351 start_codon:yes stop_codon:yes gene_type:complete